jgi:hypothetical protein
MSMDVRQFEAQVRKTGFVLENQIAQALKAAGWTAISNRYYIDDTEEAVREIDLVAYQASKVQHFDVYTTLVISCKKSENNAWALLARDINLSDPNSDWWPLHAWSNDTALQYQLSDPGTPRRYHDQVVQLGVTEALSTPAVDVFAFQEMSVSSGAPQNDRSIFAAITSLMKAQAYEIASLPQRKTTPAVYQFNLISVVDAPLVRLMFQGDEITCASMQAEHYIARYIVRKKETFSRIRFIHVDAFAGALADYGHLHEANCNWFASECDSFYSNALKDPKKCSVLLDDFRREVGWHVRWHLVRLGLDKPEMFGLSLCWDDEKGQLAILIACGAAAIQSLNEDARVTERVAAALKRFYRYTGVFRFEDVEIPF